MKRKEGEIKGTMQEVLQKVATELNNRKIPSNYVGDISDLGNEIAYAVGNVVTNMTERETEDFIHGIRHGISLTNETH